MSGKVCLIIGGGSGTGAATAREMHARGYTLALMSPSRPPTRRVASAER